MLREFPQIETERLILNQFEVNDIPTLIQYAGDEKIAATTLHLPHPYEEKHAIAWLNMTRQGFEQQKQFSFAIRLKATGEFAGGIGIHVDTANNKAEIGYWIAVPFWGNGYATEANKAILKFGFDTLQLNKIFASHMESNLPSGKVLQKSGMTQEAVLKDEVRKAGQYISLVQYRLTREEFGK